MRIAIITDSYYPTRDGVVTTVDTTSKELMEMGHEVFIIAPDPGAEFREPGVYYFPAISFKKYKGYFLPIFRSNKIEVLEEIDPDIIHIYGVALMALKGLIASHTLKIPTVTTCITMVNEAIETYSPIKLPKDIMDKLVWIYMRNFLKRPSAVIVPTEPISEEILAHGVQPKRIERIHIGVDIVRFVRDPKDREEIRSRYGITGKKVLICAGRLSAEKNIPMLIRTMEHMDDDTVLLIVGKGPMENELKTQAARSGVSDKIIFTGFVPDEELVAHYSAADVTVSCSMFETQGLTTLEAMSCGLPAACINGRAFTEVIKDGVNGYLFGQSEEECATSIRKCLSDLPSLSSGARRTAEEYSIHETAVKLEALYADIVGSRKK